MNKYVSLGKTALYKDFSWWDTEVSRESIVDLSPRSGILGPKLVEIRNYPIKAPIAFGADRPETIGAALRQMDQLSTRETNATSTNFDAYVAELQNVCVFGKRIYFVDQGYAQLYELNRVCDRPFAGPELPPEDVESGPAKYSEFEHPTLLLSSAGSGNWGHFLIDELPRVVAYVKERAPKVVSVAMLSWAELNTRFDFDKKRQEAIRAMFPKRELRFYFLSVRNKYFLKSLDYVSPISVYPWTKAIGITANLREHFISRHQTPDLELNIFCLRSGTRNLVPEQQAFLANYFGARGFLTVYPEELSPLQQFQLFAMAKRIVGVYGAALTNAVMAPKGSKLMIITPLAANKAPDPFYADLSSVIDQEHYVYYTTRPENNNDIQAELNINLDNFVSFLETSGFLS